MIKLFIAGGNIVGNALISIFHEEAYTDIVGLYEKKQDAPAVVLARKLGIPVYHSLDALDRVKPEIVINLTGNPLLTREIRETHEGIEVIESVGAQFLIETSELQRSARTESLNSLENQRLLFEFAREIQSCDRSDALFAKTLERALKITQSPGAFIALLEGEELKLTAHSGLSKRLLSGETRHLLPDSIYDKVIKNGDLFEVKDTIRENFHRNPLLLSEKLRSFVLVPFRADGEVKGILFLADYKPRTISQRQKVALNLLLSISGVAMHWLQQIDQLRSAAREQDRRDAEERPQEKRDEKSGQSGGINEEIEKTRVMANMSHELRTPLNSIIGFSNVLLERTFGDLTENQQRYIENINASGHYLLELINNVLDIAKIESGKFEIVLETFRVEEIIQSVISIMQPLIDKKLSDFMIEIDDAVGEITADVIKLKQILYNLVSNAVKFTPEDGRAGIRVTERVINSAGYIQFSVWDTGIGIAPEDRERIFNEFEQVDNSFSRKYGGAGLGLALTKKLVQIQAGDIWVESTPGEGSTFSFTLPIISAHEGKMPEPAADAVSLDFPWMSEDAPLILVVEDDIATAELLTIHLTQAGYRVSHAYNGEEAIKKAQKLKPFAITLDVMIPGKDGWEVLQELKSSPGTSDIPVIIHSVVDNKDLAFALGATDYLLKPLNKDALLSKLEDISLVKGKAAAPTTILIVEPEENEARNLKEMIGQKNVLFYVAENGKRGMELAFALRPGLIILDFDLPDMQSFDFVRAMKDAHTTKDIPIFILSQQDLTVEERLSLVGKIERIMKKHAVETQELVNHIKELEILYPQKAGLIDELTGLFNHRYFQLRLAQEVERAMRYKLPLILVMIDVDDFGHYVKEKGEHYAHSALKKVAELLRKNIRGSDVLVRYGGDSFALILPNTVISAGLSLSNRYNAIVKNYPFLYADVQPRGKITVSVGLTFLDGQSPEEIILCTERALRKAIDKGGDRVEVYEKETLQDTPVC